MSANHPSRQRSALHNVPTIPLTQNYSWMKIRGGLFITLFGYLLFLIGARPGLFGMDRSPIIGFVQIAVFLIGLGFICIGGYISLAAVWNSQPRSIAADFGLRFVYTGYVIAVFAGMADIFGLGSHPLPGLAYFGPWQARGVELGQGLIGLGFLFLIPFGGKKSPEEGHPASPLENSSSKTIPKPG